MKAKHIAFIILTVVIIVTVYYSIKSGQDDAAYISQVEKERKEKDELMQSKDSPFDDSVEQFTGLKYFPVNTDFRVVADIVPIENKKIVTLPTSDGKEKKYLEYAYADFQFGGKENRLLILEMMDMGPYRGTLFIPFGDATSAKETYGAGRYLDIKKVPGSTTVTLDFNKAYNPYCAYNDNYSCPFPPAENLLTIAIEAGEKTYH